MCIKAVEYLKDDFKENILPILVENKGKTLGTLLGIMLGIAVLCFGFWNTVFVLLAGLVGLFIGVQLDNGVDVAGEFRSGIIRLWERFERR